MEYYSVCAILPLTIHILWFVGFCLKWILTIEMIHFLHSQTSPQNSKGKHQPRKAFMGGIKSTLKIVYQLMLDSFILGWKWRADIWVLLYYLSSFHWSSFPPTIFNFTNEVNNLVQAQLQLIFMWRLVTVKIMMICRCFVQPVIKFFNV